MAITFPSRLAPRTQTLLAGVLREIGRRARSTSRVARARAGYAGGVATTTWGIGVQFGLSWALMAGGVATAVSFLLLYDVDGGP